MVEINFPETRTAFIFGRQCNRLGFDWEQSIVLLRNSEIPDKRDERSFALGYGACVHFIGFRGNEYINARRIWGTPDFFHRGWDNRAKREIADYDIVVFAKGDETKEPSPYSFNDSEVM